MKKMKINKNAIAAGIAAIVLIIATSCSKDDSNPARMDANSGSGEMSITDKGTQKKIQHMAGQLPTLAVYNSTMDKFILLDLNRPKNGFSFANPGGGLGFSGPSGSVEFVGNPDGSYVIVTTPSSSGGGGGGGIVTAGSVTLDINYVICFNSGDEDMDINLFDVGGPTDGFSGAIGVAGDFEALSSGEIDEDTDPFDFFQGMVFYYVFDGAPSGTYEIIDFFEAESEEDFDNKGYAFLFSFQDDGGIFFAADGELNFTNGSVGFSGTYFGLTDFILNFDEELEDEPEFVMVEGTGVLQCN